jgi:hypothetical protein
LRLFRIPLVVEEYSLGSVILDLLIPERKLPSGLKIPFGDGSLILTPGRLLGSLPFFLTHLPIFLRLSFLVSFLLIFSPLSCAFGLESLSSKNGLIYLPMIRYAPSIHK